MGNHKKCCVDCVWVERFRPRQDEVDRGHFLGCRYPNYEGYTSYDHMACDGVFFSRHPHLDQIESGGVESKVSG